ncbi:unnamed protein product [Aphanomyces euteiches]|uniref:Uncharacterized protein n=1 Tax=Aphanomyces euteiches TaxID=100861 RepID=A0A6G0XD38_9STRA|nr:hypothetical protein Ae201684_005973 [Aphanomyces euteiches]KAH9069301.1 hypothetical protein Ae201684P_004987 [Aphanomyces euteiches]
MLQPIDRLKLAQNATWFACCASMTRQRPHRTLSQLACLQQLLVVLAVVVGISSVDDALRVVLPIYWHPTYSYSSSLVVDRRYEDANGRLKAVHERRVNEKKIVTTWRKPSKDDDGKHETLCSEGTSTEEFEKIWQESTFAKAHKSPKSLESQEDTKAMEDEHAKSSIQS